MLYFTHLNQFSANIFAIFLTKKLIKSKVLQFTVMTI